jgi:hypothetical protein
MTLQVFANGHGGKHAAGNSDAARWRRLTAEIAANIRTAHPEMQASMAIVHAEDEAQHVTHLMNRRYRQGGELWPAFLAR